MQISGRFKVGKYVQFVWLALILWNPAFGQEPSRQLAVDDFVQAILGEEAELVQTPTLDDGYSSKPAVGHRYDFSVEQGGRHVIELRSFAFDAYLVLRSSEGELIAEDDDGGVIGSHARVALELEEGQAYRLTACALHGERGAYALSVVGPDAAPTTREALVSSERAAVDRHIAYLEREEGEQSITLGFACAELADFLFQQGFDRETIVLLRRSLSIFEEALGEDAADTQTIVNNLATVLSIVGQSEAARELFERGLAVRERLLGPDHPEVARLLSNLSDLLSRSDDLAGAAALLERSVAIWTKAYGEGHADTLLDMRKLAMNHFDQGHYEIALSQLERSVALCDSALGPEHRETVIAKGVLGEIYDRLGDFAKAQPLLEQSLEAHEKLVGPEHPATAGRVYALGHLYASTGQYEQARPLYERALAIYESRSGPTHSSTTRVLTGLALVNHKQSRYAEAHELYERVLAARRETHGPEHSSVGVVLQNIAALYRAEKKLDEARRVAEQALAIGEKAYGKDHVVLTSLLNNIGHIAQQQGRYSEARDWYQRALALWEAGMGANHPRTAAGINNLAFLETLERNYDEAERLHLRALEVRRSNFISDHPDISTSLHNLADVYEARGELDRAHGLRMEAMQGILRYLDAELPTMTEAGRLQLLAGEASPGFLLSNLSKMESPNLVEAFELYLEWKGKSTRLQEASLRMSEGPQAEFCRLQRGKLRGVTQELSELVRLPEEDRGSDHSESLNALRAERLALERELNREIELDEVLSTPSFRQLQSAIPESTTVIDFFVDSEVFAWILTGDAEPRLLALGPAQPIYDAQVALLQGTLPASAVRGGSRLSARVEKESAGDLHALLWQPVQAVIGDADTVLIAPDRFLCELPFGTIPVDDKRFLIENFRFGYVSDVTRLTTWEQASSHRDGSMLVVGDVDYWAGAEGAAVAEAEDTTVAEASAGEAASAAESGFRAGRIGAWSELAGTAKEMLTIHGLYPWNTDDEERYLQLKGDEASESRLRSALPGRRYVHLATHGYFEPSHLKSVLSEAEAEQVSPEAREEARAVGLLPGLLSGLVLAGANRPGSVGSDDGHLSAEEIQYLDLTECDLAVLSACETALGSARAGEGLMSLRRAFAVAGTETVISSLWKVDDRATAELMRLFYSYHWGQGMGRGEALHRARIDLLHSNRETFEGDARPSTWGAFVISGAWN